jgi:hypothetical protein
MLCIQVKVNQYLGGTYCIHLQHEGLSHDLLSFLAYFSDSKDWDDRNISDYKDITSHKAHPFIYEALPEAVGNKQEMQLLVYICRFDDSVKVLMLISYFSIERINYTL